MKKYKLKKLDKFNCILQNVKTKQDYYQNIEDLEKEIEELKVSSLRFSNLYKREQLVICEKNSLGWRFEKILGEEILKDLK